MLDTFRSEVRKSINIHVDEPICRETMVRALARSGFVLHPESRCRAGVLTSEIYRAVHGSLNDISCQAAAAVELQMNAAYMFDHVADQELNPDDGLSAAEELALAIGVLNCGSAVACCAASLAGSAGIGLDALLEFHKNYVGACGGQFLDAYMERRNILSSEEALNMTTRKSGSLGRFAAAFGAGLATEDQNTVHLFGQFGLNLFTYMQLIDDLQDACPADGPMRDFDQRKKTVPLSFFYNYVAEERGISPDDIMLRIMTDPVEIRHEFQRSGAKLFCAILAEAFLNRARGNLAELKGLSYSVGSLEELVETVEFRPQEVLAA